MLSYKLKVVGAWIGIVVCICVGSGSLFLLYDNSNAHGYFVKQLSLRSPHIVKFDSISNERDIQGQYLFEGGFSNKGVKHTAKVRLVLQPDGKFTSTGLVGPYYFENMGLYTYTNGTLNVTPVVGSGTRLPFYGEFEKGALGFIGEGMNYYKHDYVERIPHEQYHYSVWKDPRLYVFGFMFLMAGVLYKHRPVPIEARSESNREYAGTHQ